MLGYAIRYPFVEPMRAKSLLVVLPMLVAGCNPGSSATPPPSASQLEGLNIDPAEFGKIRHFVTTQMELETKAMTQKVAPAFSRTDDFGKTAKVGQGDRPQMVIFVKFGCPCSVDAQPLFNRLARKFDGKVDFVAVIDKKGKDFSNQFSVPYPILDEPSKGLMKAFDARASVYSALVARNGHIVKMWPGYSADWLKEMNALMAKASATKETPFDPQYAPKEKASGCPFQ
jgi:thiol-disulfide isomerase/thioredoxin